MGCFTFIFGFRNCTKYIVIHNLFRQKEILVKHGDKYTPYEFTTDTTVRELKCMISEQENMDADDMELEWCGHRLNDKATMNESNLEDGMTIQLIQR